MESKTAMRILIVSGDSEARIDLAKKLTEDGHYVDTPEADFDDLRIHPYHQAAILDLSKADLDNYDLCRTIRTHSDMPIIAISETYNEFDCVLALRLGADDYVTKPYRAAEFIARLRAISRRIGARQGAGARTESGKGIEIGPIRVDLDDRRVYAEEREVMLSRKEFDLLATLVMNCGKVLTKDFLMREIWKYSDARDTRTLGVHIASLRKKLAMPSFIKTVHGIGYRIAV
jgi:two-component system, OmpR family, response regulator RegX3